MLTGNNLNLLDNVVESHQSRLRTAARDARGHLPRSRVAGEHSLRVRLGDRQISWGVSLRGGLPSGLPGGLPDVPVTDLPGLAQRS